MMLRPLNDSSDWSLEDRLKNIVNIYFENIYIEGKNLRDKDNKRIFVLMEEINPIIKDKIRNTFWEFK